MMKPRIEFKHVLGELSVNRHDPCEILRELLSNSYDARATNILYSPLIEERGLIFYDNGTGLHTAKQTNGITPWEAFFSIGKSTKMKGAEIGYKCQGSKLCFASSRILIATKESSKNKVWHFKIINNPRQNLDVTFDITPTVESDISSIISTFLPSPSSQSSDAIGNLVGTIEKGKPKTATLVIIDGLDTENFGRYFSFGKKPEESYVYNYIRFFTKHGDTRYLNKGQGFALNVTLQISSAIKPAALKLYSSKKLEVDVPFGYPYLEIGKGDIEIKSPSQVSRLRDGRFYSRAAKAFSVGGENYSVVMAIDGNRRSHEEYKALDRKGKTKSGLRLSDQRGFFISVSGIKICKYLDILNELDDYKVLAEGESPSNFSIIIDGGFDLVTNRNSLSKKAFDTLSNPDFIKEIKSFLDHIKNVDKVFLELLSRLRRESTENRLNDQMEILADSSEQLKIRERFRIEDASQKKHLFLSPMPGEEYLVGVLYAVLCNMVPPSSPLASYWKKVLTFSTQGIDSLGMKDENATSPLDKDNIRSIEYKFEFNNFGPFNHALAIVDFIIAWTVVVNEAEPVSDTYTCFGSITKSKEHDFVWEISEIESSDGSQYPTRFVTVICLKDLITKTFGTTFKTPQQLKKVTAKK